MIQSLIAWFNEHSGHQLSTIAQPWTASVSVRGHSWPTFSLFLPVQSSLFTFLCAEFFISYSVQNAKGVSVISEWSSHCETLHILKAYIICPRRRYLRRRNCHRMTSRLLRPVGHGWPMTDLQSSHREDVVVLRMPLVVVSHPATPAIVWVTSSHNFQTTSGSRWKFNAWKIPMVCWRPVAIVTC